MGYIITRNEAFNSLEISFDGKPAEAVRDALKALRFRWHGDFTNTIRTVENMLEEVEK